MPSRSSSSSSSKHGKSSSSKHGTSSSSKGHGSSSSGNHRSSSSSSSLQHKSSVPDAPQTHSSANVVSKDSGAPRVSAAPLSTPGAAMGAGAHQPPSTAGGFRQLQPGASGATPMSGMPGTQPGVPAGMPGSMAGSMPDAQPTVASGAGGSMAQRGSAPGGSLYNNMGNGVNNTTGSMARMNSMGNDAGSAFGNVSGNKSGSLYANLPNKPSALNAPAGSAYNGAQGSMYGAMPGSMGNGMQGSMYGSAMPGSMGRMGSMGPGGMGSGYGRMPGSMYAMGSMMPGSMYGMGCGGMPGSMFGGMPGSMYGMPGSMYGMGPMAASMYGMGSMYGMNPFAASMYGMRSMYGMAGSMYGMPGSMYGMGSMYNAQSMYQSRAGSFGGQSSNGDSKVAGLFNPEQEKEESSKKQPPPPPKKVYAELHVVTDKSDDDKDDEKDRAAESKPVRAAPIVKVDAVPAAIAKAPEAKTNAALDEHVHGVVLLQQGYNTDYVKIDTNEKKCTIVDTTKKSTEFRPTEMLPCDKDGLSRSVVLNDILTNVMAGHNAALVLLSNDRARSTPVVVQAATHVMRTAAEQLDKDTTVKKWTAYATAALLLSATQCRDLIDKSLTAKDVTCGAHSLYGACVMNLKSRTLSLIKDVEDLCQQVLSQPEDPQHILALQLIFAQERDDAVLLSSLTVFSLKDVDVAEAIVAGDKKRVAVPLFKTAVGGPCRTAVLVPLTGEKNVLNEETALMRTLTAFCVTLNTAPCSGNVARFISHNEEQRNEMQHVQKTQSGDAKERSQRNIAHFNSMLISMHEFLAAPHTKAPPAYPVDGTANGSAAAPAEKSASAKAEKSASDKTEKSASDKAEKQPQAQAQSQSKTQTQGQSKTQPVTQGQSHLQSKPQGQSLPQASRDASGGPDTGAAPALTATGKAHTQPFSAPHRLAVIVNSSATSTTTSRAVRVKDNDKTKAYDVDEAIVLPEIPSDGVVASNDIRRLAEIFRAGYNVSLLSAECEALIPLQRQVTWVAVRSVLESAMTAKPNAAETSTIMWLRMIVLCQQRVVADVLAPSETVAKNSSVSKAPDDVAANVTLSVVVSPLFGPVPEKTTCATIKDVASLTKQFDKALTRAAPLMCDANNILVVSAVLKTCTKSDVIVSSLLASSASSMTPYTKILEGNSAYPRTLFAFALNGPTSLLTCVVVNPDKQPIEAVEALNGQYTLAHTKTSRSPVGSVKAFVAYMKSSQESTTKRLEQTKDANMKARLERNLKRIHDSLRDYSALLKASDTTEPAMYAAELSSTGDTMSTASHADAAQTNGMLSKTASTTTTKTKDTTAESKAADATTRQPAEADAAAKKTAKATELPPEPTGPAGIRSADHAAARASDDKLGIKFLAVITDEIRAGLKPMDGWSVEEKDGLVVTDVVGPHKFEVDEVVKRATRNAPVQAKLLNTVCDMLLQGYNVALLTADTRGSAAGLEMVDRTARTVLSRLGADMELFVSLCALKERTSTVRDTLKEGSNEFKPLQVSVSPLFGPAVSDVTFEKIATVDAFVKVMSNGLRICGENRACVVLQLVLCRVVAAEKDVVVSSLLATMCPGDVSLYRNASQAPIADRGLFQYALGGPCFTVFAAGFTREPIDESCLAVAKLVQSICTNKNTQARNGSVKRFIEHTKGAIDVLHKDAAKMTAAADVARIQSQEANMAAMLHHAKTYIENPAGKVPPVYKK